MGTLVVNGLRVAQRIPEAYSDFSPTSKMELFAQIVDGFQLLTIFAKSSILAVLLGSEYASGHSLSDKCQIVNSFFITRMIWQPK